MAIITISNKPLRISSKGPIRISNEPIIAPLIISVVGPVPYTSDKAVPWNYGVEVYYHGVKQDSWIDDNEAGVTNIAGSSKVTRTRRVFSPNISPPTTTAVPIRITNGNAGASTRGKEKESEPVREEELAKKNVMEEPSTQEMEEILKIIKKSDFKIVE